MIRLIALAVTWRGDRSAQLRSVVLALSVAAVTVLACAVVSAALMAARVNERSELRTFQPAAPDQRADIMQDAKYDSVNGEQIFVYLWRIETEGVVIPGVAPDAETGDWFVSPELARRIEHEPLLEDRFPNARTIGNDGVGSADELVAYRFVGPEVELRGRLVDVPGTDWIGWNAGIDGSIVAFAGAGLVVVLGIGFLRAALGPISVGLARRLSLLAALGATRPSLWMLSTASSAIVSAPAAAVSAVAWYLIAPGLESVPLVGQKVLKGDLQIPLLLAIVVAFGVVALTAAVALTRPYQHIGSRPASRVPSPPALWRVIPLLASLAIIVYSTAQSGSGAVRSLLAGLIAACLSVTFALPVLIHLLGNALARRKSTLSLLVGRTLSSNAVSSSRPLLALAAVAVLVPSGASFIATARAGDPSPPPSSVQTITVNGRLDYATLSQLEQDAGGVFVDVYATEPQDRRIPATFTWVADCESLAPYMVLDRCGPNGIVVEAAAAPAFAWLGASSTRAPSNATLDRRLFVTLDGDRAEAVLRSYAVNNYLNRIIVATRNEQRHESRVVPWLISGMQIAAAGAFAALLLSVITHASQSAATRLRLVGIGAELPMIRQLAATESFTTVAVVGLFGTAAGTVGAVAYALVNGSVSPNYWPSLTIAAATLTAAALSGSASAIYVSRVSAQSVLNTPD